MECCKCKYYTSSQYSNRCQLFQTENFRIYTKENECTEINENYIFQETFEPLGIIKGQKSDDYIRDYNLN